VEMRVGAFGGVGEAVKKGGIIGRGGKRRAGGKGGRGSKRVGGYKVLWKSDVRIRDKGGKARIAYRERPKSFSKSRAGRGQTTTHMGGGKNRRVGAFPWIGRRVKQNALVGVIRSASKNDAGIGARGPKETLGGWFGNSVRLKNHGRDSKIPRLGTTGKESTFHFRVSQEGGGKEIDRDGKGKKGVNKSQSQGCFLWEKKHQRGAQS